MLVFSKKRSTGIKKSLRKLFKDLAGIEEREWQELDKWVVNLWKEFKKKKCLKFRASIQIIHRNLKATIQQHLIDLEKRENLKILLAVESGSRAWGFPSPDSDYDVRIIYIRPLDWYLSIDDKKDTIEYFHGALLDIGGWDIRKALRLVRKSNATPFEWAQSPILYQEKADFRRQLLNHCNSFFQPRHSLNHYKGIAKNSYLSNLLTKEIKLKKLFYVLRPILAAKWIIDKQTIPPMDMDKLLPLITNPTVKEEIETLIAIKSTAKEDYIHKVSPTIQAFIEMEFQQIDDTKHLQENSTPDLEELDLFYRNLLNQYYR